MHLQITEGTQTCGGRGRHEGTLYDRHTAATDPTSQSPSVHHKPRPQHCAASDMARSDAPSQVAGPDALHRRPGSTDHQAPAILPSPLLINAC